MSDLFASLLDTVLKKQNLFSFSLFPYLAFLWFLTRSKLVPKLALAGFFGTLIFVGVTIPVGIYAERVYGTSLANVDVLHGSAEVLLTLTNILVVVGFKMAIDRLKDKKQPVDQSESSQN
jgi:hypothetical protein